MRRLNNYQSDRMDFNTPLNVIGKISQPERPYGWKWNAVEAQCYWALPAIASLLLRMPGLCVLNANIRLRCQVYTPTSKIKVNVLLTTEKQASRPCE